MGAVARIVAQLLDCARDVVSTDHAQVAASSPAAPQAGSDPSGDITAADVAAPEAMVGDDRFDMALSMPPACLMAMEPRKSGCGPCSHARHVADALAPRGYYEQCSHYRHVSEEVVRPEELTHYCEQCERPCCLECGKAELGVHNHTVIPLSQARDNLAVRLPSISHTSHCVFSAAMERW